jgi:hypothetical protein
MMEAWRLPFVVGTVVRLAYGVGAVLVPEAMAEHRLAPRLDGAADARMNLRGFGGALSAIALYSLAAARTPHRARSVLWLNALTDAFDAGVTLLERRDRGTVDRVVAGGLAINVAGMACWTLAARTLRRAAA